jgi:anti-anti-sigma factor
MSPQTPELECDIVEPDGEVLVAIRGELDLVTLQELEECLEAALDPGKDVFVDLSGATFVDGRGARALFGAAATARARGHRFQVSTPSASVRLLLEQGPGAPDDPITLD